MADGFEDDIDQEDFDEEHQAPYEFCHDVTDEELADETLCMLGGNPTESRRLRRIKKERAFDRLTRWRQIRQKREEAKKAI